MFGWFRGLFIFSALFFFEAQAIAQETPRVEQVSFHNGRAVIHGVIKGYEMVDYVFRAGAGESIKLSLATRAPSNYFNLLAPGATEEAMFTGQNSMENTFDGVGSASGDYTARVYMMRNEARRGKVARYTLTIEVGQKSATNERGPDFADGLTGGPDFWEVTGVAAGDRLHLRAAATARSKRVASVRNGDALKNAGCKNTQGHRWCRVSTKAGAQGWANGAYLREGGGW